MAQNNKVLYIVRGIPGSGKSTLGDLFADQAFSADEYMVDERGKYKFDPAKLKECHDNCFRSVVNSMKIGAQPVLAVCNTFTQEWEYMRYIFAALAYGYDPIGLNVQGLHENIHGCPGDQILKMEGRFQHNIAYSIAFAKEIMEGLPYRGSLGCDANFENWVKSQYKKEE